MDHWIDDLARAAVGLSRRQVLRRMGGVVAGGVLASLLPRSAAAQANPGTCRDFCQGTGQPSLKGEQLAVCMRACQACGGDASKLCGSGAATLCCAEEQFCNGMNQCVPPTPGQTLTCPPGTTFCQFSGCCPRGTVCQGGTCVAP
jgi:hypothetical protein